MTDNEPKNPKLWGAILDLARGKSSKPVSANGETVNPVNGGKGFQTWPSAYGVGWALAQYKRLKGNWGTKKRSSALSSVQSLVSDLENEYEGLSLVMYDPIEGDEYNLPIVKLKAIHFPKEKRGQGYGSFVMLDIKRWADKNNVMIALTPSTDLGGSSVARLKRFYQQFGYKPNKGTNKDFRVLETMIYDPSKNKRKATVDSICSEYTRTARKRDKRDLKNTGHGGLDTWFAGHGGGDPEERATWGDWIAITPVKHTIEKEDGKDKTYEPGDIVGPCAVSSEADWKGVTSGGKKPLKCMPREKAYGMSKAERAELAKNKRRQENKHRGQKPVNTPTFSDEAKEIKSKAKKADFYRQVSAPDSLSSYSNGTPVNRHEDNKAESSSLPNGDTARNIGRPSPDSPNLKYRNLDRSESYGRTPANKEDFGYVHDSGSGSARVIPYDSGFANNSSPLRNAGLIRPPQHLIEQVAEIGKGLVAQYWLRREQEDSAKGGLDPESVEGLEFILEELEYLPTGVKRGEHDLEEVIFQVNNVQRSFSEIEDQLKSAGLEYPDFYKLKAKIDLLNAQSIFNGPRGNKTLIGSISDMTTDILRELKKWSTGGKQYIPTLMRDDYLEAVEQLSKYKVKDGGRYYIEDDELGLVSVRLQESSHGAAQYYWDGIHHIIFNVLKNMTTLPLKYLQDRETIAGHELVHAMQQHYANKANIEGAGLPGQTRGKKFRLDMMEKQKELRVQYAREGMDSELISIHALDDIEFYSRLLDEVTDFKRRRVSAEILNDEIRKWFSDRTFWVSLKRYKRKNWRKAVGIFVDAVSPEPRSKRAGSPIRIDKAKIKDLTNEAVKFLEGVAQKTRETTLFEALKRTTRSGAVNIGSYTVENEKTGYSSSVDLLLKVRDTHENGTYSYDLERGSHVIEIYIKDQPIRLLTSPLYNISIKPAWVKHIYSTLIHEITHAIDQIKYQQIEEDMFGGGGSQFDKSKIKTRKDKRKTLETYYNNPSEVKAYLQQIADEVEEYLILKHGGVSKESINNGWRDAFGFYGSKTWKQVSSFLTPKNQKYIKKAVISYLMRIIDSDTETPSAVRVARRYISHDK